MNKIKLKLVSFLRKFQGSLSILFTAALVILVFFEVLVIKRSISTVVDIARANPEIKATQLVRVNFGAYDKIVKRIEDAPGFTPSINISHDPFGIINTSKPTTK